jgi:two-component system probable response regulator PhcQ
MSSVDPGGYAVLFVDDEEKALKYFRMAYARDFPVLTAGSVPEALGVLAERWQEIGVLITDQRMPGQQGVDLLKRAREDWPGIVRILTTAYSDLEDAIAAVNRGEILRYVTKPWDVQGLRAELRHAMDYFQLRRERDMLLGEKLSVRRRMQQDDRLRGMLTIAAGAEHLRHAAQAVAAWTREGAPRGGAQPGVAALELWGLDVAETLSLMSLHRRLRGLDARAVGGFPDRVLCADLARGIGLPAEGEGPAVGGRAELLEELLSVLAAVAGRGAAGAASCRIGPDGAGGLTVTVTGAVPEGAMGAEATRAELLVAYLIAWHHGGSLTTALGAAGVRFVLRLPADPAGAVLPEPDADWLTEQFMLLQED